MTDELGEDELEDLELLNLELDSFLSRFPFPSLISTASSEHAQLQTSAPYPALIFTPPRTNSLPHSPA
jgi:hypothetical protein